MIALIIMSLTMTMSNCPAVFRSPLAERAIKEPAELAAHLANKRTNATLLTTNRKWNATFDMSSSVCVYADHKDNDNFFNEMKCLESETCAIKSRAASCHAQLLASLPTTFVVGFRFFISQLGWHYTMWAWLHNRASEICISALGRFKFSWNLQMRRN